MIVEDDDEPAVDMIEEEQKEVVQLELEANNCLSVAHMGDGVLDCKFNLVRPTHGLPPIGQGRNPTWARRENRTPELRVGMMIAVGSGAVEGHPVQVAKIKKIFVAADTDHAHARVQWYECKDWGKPYTPNPGDANFENIALSEIPFITPWVFVHWSASDSKRQVLTAKNVLQAMVLKLACANYNLQKNVMVAAAVLGKKKKDAGGSK